MRFAPVLFAVFALASAHAATYRWVDPASGRVMFSDLPPPGNAKSVSQASAGTPTKDDDLPYATRKAMESFPVILYTAPNCTDTCKQARELLAKRKVPFTEKSVQKEEDMNELRSLTGEASVPVLKVGRQTAKGFAAETYHGLLDLAGYPGALRPAEKKDEQ